MTLTYPRIVRNGEAALAVEFGNSIDPHVHAKVTALDEALRAEPVSGIIETLPTYRSLYVSFDPATTDRETLSQALKQRIRKRKPGMRGVEQLWTIPVCFELPYGEDVEQLSDLSGLPGTDLVKAFCDQTLTVYMFGFAPGYAFLGKLPPYLTFPRRETPRPPIASGTLITAGGQASVATCPMPTGWHVIGRTPQPIWGDSEDETTTFLSVGDHVRFKAISGEQFDELTAKAEAGDPVMKRHAAR